MHADHGPRVLIIDNDEAMAEAVATRLEAIGLSCVTAFDGAHGLSEFESHEFDLVITDLNMPAGDGITVATSLRKTSDVPILVITGYPDEYWAELKSVSNVTVLPKPFNTELLLELVEAELAARGRFTT